MSKALAVHHGAFGRVVLYHLDRDMTLHAHREGHLVFHLDGAPATFTVEGAPVDLTPEQAPVVNPWQPHSFAVGDAEQGSIFLTLYISPTWFLENGHSGPAGLRFGRDRIYVTDAIRRYVSRIANYMIAGDSPSLLSGLLFELTQECYDQSWQWSPDSTPMRDACSVFCDYRVRKSIKLIETKLREDFEMDMVARDVGLSRPHFFKLFKKQMGVTPNIFANTLRMELAIDELTRGEKSITEISYDLSFSSQASFSRFFSLNSGVSPSNYRQVAQLGAA